MTIAVLPPAVAARIAAGEVVERPASVVKELVENALDAGASRIDVALSGGGLERIQVADTGHGIEAGDVEHAFLRHATSKLTSDDDLSRLSTLGFRGEALPSIAAVADVVLSTRVAHEQTGVRVALRGGLLVERRPVGRAVGTTVEATDLFGAVPARRKFLRSTSAEAAHVTQLLGQIALVNPHVAFRLTLDGRETLVTDGSGSMADAARALYGDALARDLLPVAWEAEEGPPVAIHGVIGHRDAHRSNRAALWLYVNRRPIQSRPLSAAVEDACRTLIPTGRHPIAALNIELDPSDLDVNVHPTKAEVRLLRERQIFGAIQRAIHAALSHAGVASALYASDSAGAPQDEQRFRGLRVLGQVGQTYIIAEGEAGLYLVDQHAAHERVLYEDLSLAQLVGPPAQLLLEPLTVELSSVATSFVHARRSELLDSGFDVEPFGPRAVLIRSVPAFAGRRSAFELASEVLGSLSEEGEADDWRERIRIVASCKGAVRAGDTLSAEEMLGLLQRLGEKDLCRTCSHGRPTALLLSHRQLEQEFGRR